MAQDTRDPLTWSGVTYYLGARERSIDEAWKYYGQPGVEMAREAFEVVDERAALDSVRRVVAATSIPAEVDIVTRAKLRALLRNPHAFVPCRSLAKRG